MGELYVAFSKDRNDFRLLSPVEFHRHKLTNEKWQSWCRQLQAHVLNIDAKHRRHAAANENEYWSARHQLARKHVATLESIEIPSVEKVEHVSNPIDQFIVHRLEARSIEPAAVTSDLNFLRRVTLDTVGVIPTIEEIEQFLHDRPDRRARVINRLLDDPRWADHWVGYWQGRLGRKPQHSESIA